MVDKDKAHEKLEELRMEAYMNGEDLQKANERFEKWLTKQEIKQNIKENPSMYRGRKC